MKIGRIIEIFFVILILGGDFCINYYHYISKNKDEINKIHFSIDDTIDVFRDLTENEKNYDSIFDNRLLNFLKVNHDRYGMKVSMYCYYEEGDFNLTMVPDKYKWEFLENSDWLKFGFHYRNGEEPIIISGEKITEDYKILISELIRITGCTCETIRLSYFKGSYEAVSALKEQGIYCLLTADDDRKSYYFNDKINQYIAENDMYFDESNGMNFVSTDIRLDNIEIEAVCPELVKISKDFRQNKIIAVFTHEWCIEESMFEKIENMCKFAEFYNYSFTFIDKNSKIEEAQNEYFRGIRVI